MNSVNLFQKSNNTLIKRKTYEQKNNTISTKIMELSNKLLHHKDKLDSESIEKLINEITLIDITYNKQKALIFALNLVFQNALYEKKLPKGFYLNNFEIVDEELLCSYYCKAIHLCNKKPGKSKTIQDLITEMPDFEKPESFWAVIEQLIDDDCIEVISTHFEFILSKFNKLIHPSRSNKATILLALAESGDLHLHDFPINDLSTEEQFEIAQIAAKSKYISSLVDEFDKLSKDHIFEIAKLAAWFRPKQLLTSGIEKFKLDNEKKIEILTIILVQCPYDWHLPSFTALSEDFFKYAYQAIQNYFFPLFSNSKDLMEKLKKELKNSLEGTLLNEAKLTKLKLLSVGLKTALRYCQTQKKEITLHIELVKLMIAMLRFRKPALLEELLILVPNLIDDSRLEQMNKIETLFCQEARPFFTKMKDAKSQLRLASLLLCANDRFDHCADSEIASFLVNIWESDRIKQAHVLNLILAVSLGKYEGYPKNKYSKIDNALAEENTKAVIHTIGDKCKSQEDRQVRISSLEALVNMWELGFATEAQEIIKDKNISSQDKKIQLTDFISHIFEKQFSIKEIEISNNELQKLSGEWKSNTGKIVQFYHVLGRYEETIAIASQKLLKVFVHRLLKGTYSSERFKAKGIRDILENHSKIRKIWTSEGSESWGYDDDSLRVELTFDALTLFTMGIWVPTCLNPTHKSDNNPGLFGMLLDGSLALLKIGKESRATVRLVKDNNDNIILFMDKIHTATSEFYRHSEALFAAIKKLASDMDIQVYLNAKPKIFGIEVSKLKNTYIECKESVMTYIDELPREDRKHIKEGAWKMECLYKLV